MLTVFRAADATSHLFFAYLRSLSPDSVRGINGISALPLSLQTLVQETRYPPEQGPYQATSKVVMVVDSVSPTPFALLRRAKNFEYRDEDRVLQAFSSYEDPVQALSDECRRVLKSISSINDSGVSTTKASTSLGDASWSRFEDLGFGAIGEYDDEPDSTVGRTRKPPQGLRTAPQTKNDDLGRPTTPSWADFLSSGFVNEASSPGPRPLLLPRTRSFPRSIWIPRESEVPNLMSEKPTTLIWSRASLLVSMLLNWMMLSGGSGSQVLLVRRPWVGKPCLDDAPLSRLPLVARGS